MGRNWRCVQNGNLGVQTPGSGGKKSETSQTRGIGKRVTSEETRKLARKRRVRQQKIGGVTALPADVQGATAKDQEKRRKRKEKGRGLKAHCSKQPAAEAGKPKKTERKAKESERKMSFAAPPTDVLGGERRKSRKSEEKERIFRTVNVDDNMLRKFP